MFEITIQAAIGSKVIARERYATHTTSTFLGLVKYLSYGDLPCFFPPICVSHRAIQELLMHVYTYRTNAGATYLWPVELLINNSRSPITQE